MLSAGQRPFEVLPLISSQGWPFRFPSQAAHSKELLSRMQALVLLKLKHDPKWAWVSRAPLSLGAPWKRS